MEHLSTDSPHIQESIDQGIKVKESDISDTQIAEAGRDINQAQRDIITNIINTTDEIWSKSKIEQVRRLETSLRLEFQEKLNQVSSRVSELRRCIEAQLSIESQTDSAAILQLFDELQSIVGHENKVKAIKDELAFYQEAASWLEQNTNLLAHHVKTQIFSQRKYPKLRKKSKNAIPSEQLEKNFLKDIILYLAWITTYLKSGATPKKPNKREFDLKLDFSSGVYKDAFEIIPHEMLAPEVSGLSVDAANKIASYINRFLIDRNLDVDA